MPTAAEIRKQMANMALILVQTEEAEKEEAKKFAEAETARKAAEAEEAKKVEEKKEADEAEAKRKADEAKAEKAKKKQEVHPQGGG
jgi:hypothetical protein